MKSLKYALLLTVAFCASTVAESRFSRDEQLNVIVTHSSAVVAAIACKNVLDDGETQLNNTISSARTAILNATNDEAYTNDVISNIVTSINSSEPAKHLLAEFDAVKANNEMRQQKCGQLLAGNKHRATELDLLYGLK